MRPTVALLWHDRSGGAAVEFAILAPAFLMMLIGTIMLAMMFFTMASLHFAVETAARCASVKTTVCTSAVTTQAVAASTYFGATAAPTFICTGRTCGGSSACGNQVTGQVDFTLDWGMGRLVTPLRAAACYP